MFPEQYLLIWNPVPWTVSDPDLLDRFSDQTILFLATAVQVSTQLVEKFVKLLEQNPHFYLLLLTYTLAISFKGK